tara:strand:+ start:2703 stop:4166 length:1464 start_codon:yes stop_codon:yes gene_type:complete
MSFFSSRDVNNFNSRLRQKNVKIDNAFFKILFAEGNTYTKRAEGGNKSFFRCMTKDSKIFFFTVQLLSGKAELQDLEDRFLRINQLKNPHLNCPTKCFPTVATFDSWMSNVSSLQSRGLSNCLFCLVDLCPRGDLFSIYKTLRTQKATKELKKMSYLFFPCVEALHGLHRLNMFHLDIKLGNFFLCEDTNKKSVIALGDLDEIIWYDSDVAQEHVSTPSWSFLDNTNERFTRILQTVFGQTFIQAKVNGTKERVSLMTKSREQLKDVLAWSDWMQFGVSYLFFAGILKSNFLERLIYGDGLVQRDYDAMLGNYTKKKYDDRIPKEDSFTGYALHDVIIKALLLSKTKQSNFFESESDSDDETTDRLTIPALITNKGEIKFSDKMILLDDNSNGMKNYSAAIVLQMFKTLQMEKLVRSKENQTAIDIASDVAKSNPRKLAQQIVELNGGNGHDCLGKCPYRKRKTGFRKKKKLRPGTILRVPMTKLKL